MPLTLKRDHLFLVREGQHIWKSEEFKVVLLEASFETGTMTGLMTLFGRHSGFMTNFSILLMESRRIGLKLRVRELQVCGGARGPGVPAGTRWAWELVLVGPWQYQCARAG